MRNYIIEPNGKIIRKKVLQDKRSNRALRRTVTRSDNMITSVSWRHPYNFDAEILFGYAGNIVFYNIVSVSIDMIAYERINAENCSMKERLTTYSFPAMSRSGSAEMWIGCDETEIF
ncbi:hypothetical protein DPMN_164086 [Dreissena polymorpha]|uniref:Uncharacterized protein n=1 Tax=Dreissena polymorpha TaxID=45954 RepID=A0A9D4IVS6_DREPO|nr:hypothetical protein DPMN_164086 [Dreissena polymorpha]